MTALALHGGSARRRWRGLILPAVLLLAWEASSLLGLVDPRMLPPVSAVAERAWAGIVGGELAAHIGASLARDLAGFLIGSAAGIPAGLLLGLSGTANRVAGPTFDALKQIAIFAWIPLISVWFGVGEQAKIVFIALAAFTPVVVNTWSGVRSVPVPLREVARTLAFSRSEMLTRLVLPAALPSIFVGLHLGLIHSWLATVGAEYFMTVGPGIGGLMIEGRDLFHMDLVLLGVVLLGGIGLGLNQLANAAEAHALRWQRR